MFGRFMPREDRFFDLFNQHAEQMVQAAELLVSLITAPAEEMSRIIARIDAIETQAGKLAHNTLGLLHTTYITPFDRDAIHALVNEMDEVVDSIQDVAENISLFNIRRLTPDTTQLAELNQVCCTRVRQAVRLLDKLEQGRDILSTCREIERIETECDRVFRNALGRLFREERDPLQVIKMKEIYEGLERISDACEDVSKVIEGLVLEHR